MEGDGEHFCAIYSQITCRLLSTSIHDSFPITPVMMNCYCSFWVTCQNMIEVEYVLHSLYFNVCVVCAYVCVPTYLY